MPEATREQPPEIDTEFAIYLAKLWRAGTMAAGDEVAVRNTLLAEIERIRALPFFRGQIPPL